MTDHRPPRLRPLPREVIENSPAGGAALGEDDLAMRLREALASLPQSERTAAIVAFGLDEGTSGVADQLELSEEDADAITRNALQLLRGALADVDLDDDQIYARLARRRRLPARGATDERH
jgi:DNA-directed RNA polymerase specialized sigma24 family protein